MFFFRWRFFLGFCLFSNLSCLVLSMDLTNLFSIGFNLGICCTIQIALGFMLCWVYSNSLSDSFQIMYLISDNELGSLLRLAHSTMASIIYLLIFTHIFNAMLYGLVFESAHWIWLSGFCIFMLLIVLTFLGYVLPMTQMSFWGLTVFSNILSTIPAIGNLMIYWFWGGEFINEFTLLKVHVLHIVLPMGLMGMVIIHMYLLHQYISSDAIDRFVFYNERVMFMYWFYFSDLNVMLFLCIMLTYGVFIYWSFVFHEESFIIVNTQNTPENVMPEWFFLLFFGIIKSIPSNFFGVLLLLVFVSCWSFLLCWLSGFCLCLVFVSFFCFLYWFLLFVVGWFALLTICLFPMLLGLQFGLLCGFVISLGFFWLYGSRGQG